MTGKDKKYSDFEQAIRQEMETAVGKSAETLSAARATLQDAYLGNSLSVDATRKESGLSTFVDRTVMETVEWAKPGLLRIFASNDEIVRCEPRRPQDEQNAEDATTYLNEVVFGQDTFLHVFNVISDSLLQRVGWLKVYFEENPPLVTREYSGLSEQQTLDILLDTGIDNAEVAQESTEPEPLYRITIKTEDKGNNVKVISLPPERIIYNQDAIDIASARFVAHWEDKTIAELRREKFPADILQEIADDNDTYPEEQIRNRINDDDADADSERTGGMKVVRTYEAYIQMPAKGGGLERYKVVYVGGEENSVRVLRCELWTMPRPPLFPLSSVPVPHKPVGLCLADLVTDLQRLRTELSRQMLDGLAGGNQSEWHLNLADENADLDMDQFLNRRIGGVYRSKGNVTLTPLPVDTRVAAEAAAALQMTDKSKETRTGVGQQMEGISADALAGTATGAAIYQEASNERLELIARVIAETLFKPAAVYSLILVTRHQDKPMQMRLKGRFFDWDPMKWDPTMDVRVAVGLGTGNRAKQSAGLQQIIQLQAQTMQKLGKDSPVRLTHFITACHKMAQSMGFESPEQFFGTIDDARKAEAALMQQQPAPSPEEQKIKLEQQQAAAKQQLDMQKAQADMELERQKAQAQILMEQAKMAANAGLKEQQIRADAELDALQIAMGQKGPGIGIVPGAQI